MKLTLINILLQDVDIAGFYKVYEQSLRSSRAFLEKHKGIINFIKFFIIYIFLNIITIFFIFR